mgnify:CR=1 FL=1
MNKETKKYYFVATKEEELEIDNKIYKQWTIDNSSGSPHESRQDAINELENCSYPTKLIVIRSNEDINSSKEANKEVMEEVNWVLSWNNIV